MISCFVKKWAWEIDWFIDSYLLPQSTTFKNNYPIPVCGTHAQNGCYITCLATVTTLLHHFTSQKALRIN